MGTPKGQKELWRNCKWNDDKEKLAFFNHYFKASKIVKDMVKKEVKAFKDNLIEFIKEDKIKDKKGNDRPITIKDILDRIEGG